MKIGILGGTFNPPHHGHLTLGKEIKDKVGLDKIFLIPTCLPPHKDYDLISAHHRFNMVKLAAADIGYFEVLDIEIKRGGVSYTIDTVKKLVSQQPQDEFYLIVGSDSARDFCTWKNFEELKRTVKVVVGQRDFCRIDGGEGLILVDIVQVDVSSSEVRDKVRNNEPIDKLVPTAVAEYIKEHTLYKKGGC